MLVIQGRRDDGIDARYMPAPLTRYAVLVEREIAATGEGLLAEDRLAVTETPYWLHRDEAGAVDGEMVSPVCRVRPQGYRPDRIGAALNRAMALVRGGRSRERRSWYQRL